jgi:hypothetical protein
MTADPALLAELRLLRAMGDAGRTAAAKALRTARLGPAAQYDGDLKYMIHKLDAAIVQRGGRSIFAAKPVGTLSAEAERRLEAWVFETPQRHPDAGGPKPMVGPERRRVLPGQPLPPLPAKPGRLVATLTGKLGGYASDRDGEG